ncbi:A/G-specific adenine glycosylase [Candidatus Pelagibacter sp.]|jgi:A/G-specific adenine glycosylase|uniref:A/G-specific adenine glycosylase n=1 Tax=uncultured Candidatus Pelagibacter sp. TaxID=372654 RepID=UPI0023357C92|nr:A/G-specific adenine glycosylase [uncultured Candidatus Pelagibacter sp.]MDB3969845.1 A/G-specific adenine glycosylase [Candidatus Pelagibacter sp.]MDB4811759.1 A/G-specific adenine glycosylase [Candidatus Pelagibacter sp.]MDC0465319.1 A/G-specific adenine glycosylase [Candidatus Pelagibacter sp.]MDC0898132.1 A/G-specific adenine glycosylase [Candidatus Pelagibacter sp.]
MKELIITNKILNWYDIHKRTLPWRKKTSLKKKQYYTLVSEFMLQQTQVVTVIPYFNRFIKNIPDLETLANFENRKLIKLWEGLGYYSRVRNLKKAAKIVIKDFNKKLPENFLDLKSLPGIGDYTASAILAIAFNKPFIPLDGNVERVLKRYLYLKKENQIQKNNLIESKKILGTSIRSSDYAQALMELGAIICKPKKPLCQKCPISKNCKSLAKQDFVLKKIKKDSKDKYFLLKIYKKNNKYLLVKNRNFNFLKNFNIFPMEELIRPKNFNQNLNFKMSNMNMNIKIKNNKVIKPIPFSYWIDPKKLKNHTLPTFTKKIFTYLENHK